MVPGFRVTSRAISRVNGIDGNDVTETVVLWLLLLLRLLLFMLLLLILVMRFVIVGCDATAHSIACFVICNVKMLFDDFFQSNICATFAGVVSDCVNDIFDIDDRADDISGCMVDTAVRSVAMFDSIYVYIL